MDEKKYFPIKTATSCQLKWNWSTLYLNSGLTSSCHRTGTSQLTRENFNSFHNTEVKQQDRRAMLEGKWPESNCSYCREIEQSNGVSDRMRQMTVPNIAPPELDDDINSVVVTPQIVEVYFNNYCNLGCLYCWPSLSSTIQLENERHGEFKQQGVHLITEARQAQDLIPKFWEWFPKGFPKIKRFHILGGEPLLQKEFDKLLTMIDQYPNKDCELNIVTNLQLKTERIEQYIEQFKKLLTKRKLKRIDITASIDCWGPEQEYVRYGMDLQLWKKNFKLLLSQRWLTLNINQTISALTIKTMPDLLKQLQEWRKDRKIGHWFSGVTPGPEYMKGEIFNSSEFEHEQQEILALMPEDTEENKQAHEYMKGLFKQMNDSKENQTEIKNLLVYLTEKDRRRGTNWKTTFPWLEKYNVV
jgi:pyruvate-formate lyase-activating enzyme